MDDKKERDMIDVLVDIDRGSTFAMLEVLFYLHDKKLIDKDELASRLDVVTKRIRTTPPPYNGSVNTIAFPVERMADALRSAVPVDEEGNPA